jgi:hypothetical protein
MRWWKINRKQTINAILLLGLTGLTLTACGQGSEVATPTPKAPLESPSASLQPTATPAPYTFPLTGLPSQQLVKTRPFLVMVENAPQARPQSGLDQADIVYEILAEGEITRFVSVFQSHEAKVIGPVRSIRPYFVEIGAALDAVIVHAGWSQDAMNILSGRKLSHLDQVYGDEAYYWRSKERKAPHNLYTSVEKMTQGSADRKFRQEWRGPILSFAKQGQGLPQGTAANRIQIPYIRGYVVSYAYDPAAGVYQRSMDGKPHVDKESGKQLAATNLLVLESKHQILDKVGRREVDIFGPGKGLLLQNGKSVNITWEQKNGIIRAYQNGREMPLLPGTTWVQMVPEHSEVKVE